jgi:hypothetical protein
MLRIAIMAISVAASSAVFAENCRLDGKPLPSLPFATVTAERLYFVKGSCAENPEGKGCRLGPYLVRGDKIFLGDAETGQLRCAAYLGGGGGYTEGWVDASGFVLGE